MSDTPETDSHQSQSGRYVSTEACRFLERDRNRLFEVLRQVADVFGLEDWDSTTIVQQCREYRDGLLEEAVPEKFRDASREDSGDCPGCGQYHVCTPSCPIEAAKAEAHSIQQ